MDNIKITLSYDGTNYFGWQKTKAGPSIEEKLENALNIILQKKVKINAASRTDKNVHAKVQIANFLIEKDFDLDLLKYKLNMMLPKDIRILKIQKEDINFHPTLNSKKKEYRYYIDNSDYESPHHRLYSWHIHNKIDLEKINEAKLLFIGKKDFSAFTNRKEKNNVRSIFDINLQKDDNFIMISITGDRFLYKMVRIIVGSLIYVGIGKMKIIELENILNSKSRNHLGMTAPAKGLFLYGITY